MRKCRLKCRQLAGIPCSTLIVLCLVFGMTKTGNCDAPPQTADESASDDRPPASIVDSYICTAALVLLKERGFEDPFSNPIVKVRFEEVAKLARQSMAVLESDPVAAGDPTDREQRVHTLINASVYTFATDALYILSNPNRELSLQRRQYNAFLSMAEAAFARSIEDLGVSTEAAGLGWAAFHAQEELAQDYFDRPRIAAMDKLRDQEELAVELVRFQESLEAKVKDFAANLASSRYDDPEFAELNRQGQNAIAEVYGTFIGSHAIVFFAGKNMAFMDPDSPLNAIAPCALQTAGTAGSTLIFEYYPPDDFSADALLARWWREPLPLIE